MEKSKTALMLSAILIIAFFFRVYNLKSLPPGLYPDEAINGNNALEAIETGEYKIFYPENNGREGLFINIQSLFVRAFGAEPWALRLPSALFGSLGVLGIFFLSRELFGKFAGWRKNRDRIAILSSFLMAGSFWHIIFSRIGFRAIMAPTILVWASYLLFLAFRKRDFLWENLCFGFLGGAVYGLGFHSYISYRATPLILAVPALFWLVKSVKERSLKQFAFIAGSFLIGTLIIVAPLASHFISNPADFFGRISQISIFSAESPIKDLSINALKTLFMFNFSGDANWRHNFSGYPQLSAVAGAFFLVGIFVSGKKIFKQFGDSAPELFIFSWIIVSLIPVVISNEGIPHALRAIIAIPGVMVIAAVGMDFLWSKSKKWFSVRKNGNALFKVCAATIFSFLIVEPFVMYFVLWGKNPNVARAFNQNYAEIAHSINALTKETEKHVVVLAKGIEVRGIPMPAQTVKFMTESFTEKGMEENNIHYFRSRDELPTNLDGAAIFIIE